MGSFLEQICLFGEGHCFVTRSAAALSVYCYALALAYTVSVSIQRSRLGEHGHATHLLPVKRMRWFPTFLSFSYLARIGWLLLSDMHAFEWVERVPATAAPPRYRYEHMIISVPLLPTLSIDMYVLGVTAFGKLATLLYFSAFTLLLRFWEDVLHLARRAEKPLARIAANQSVIAGYTRSSTEHHQHRAQKIVLVANVWIYLVEFALLVVKTLFPTEHYQFIFQVDYGVVAVFFCLLALMLARCAFQLRTVLLKIEFSSLAATIAARVSWLGAVCAFVFFVRSVLLLVATPAMEVFDPHRSNPWIFYTVPEILPGLVVIYMMTVKKTHNNSATSAGKRLAMMDEGTPLLFPRRVSDETVSPFEGHELSI
ncbi:hypothetical protein P43SY_010042 [Pythium insidiosum]|uniref:THH1/TOM1/TOM3 domain-containing protein n=1 Tax=Pythium insidiosum TaxID=114742 RepID=A0AAD5LXN8_PYTIN|nr:hypothetical protein P43SY_010042 [Pythium insidiosum]